MNALAKFVNRWRLLCTKYVKMDSLIIGVISDGLRL